MQFSPSILSASIQAKFTKKIYMEILIGLFIGVTILGILLAVYNWVRLGMPFGRRKTRRRKIGRQAAKEIDPSNGDNHG